MHKYCRNSVHDIFKQSIITHSRAEKYTIFVLNMRKIRETMKIEEKKEKSNDKKKRYEINGTTKVKLTKEQQWIILSFTNFFQCSKNQILDFK